MTHKLECNTIMFVTSALQFPNHIGLRVQDDKHVIYYGSEKVPNIHVMIVLLFLLCH